MSLRDARNLVFDADCALVDDDIAKARKLLRQADLMLSDLQRNEREADGSVPALRGEAVGVQRRRPEALGGRGRLHGMHERDLRPRQDERAGLRVPRAHARGHARGTGNHTVIGKGNVMKNEWTDELIQLRQELGDEEIIKRAGKLSDYDMYDGVEFEGQALNPAQAKALAAFAATLGSDVIIHNGALKRVKSLDERCRSVVVSEQAARKREVDRQFYKDEICPHCKAQGERAEKYSDKCTVCGETLPWYPYG